jgi:ComF family protein
MRGIDICEPCRADLPEIKAACRLCAHPILLANSDNLVCGECVQQQPPVHACHAMYTYEYPIAPLISKLKFHQQLCYASLLGTLMSDSVSTWYAKKSLPEVILPVPLHRTRVSSRGYNQSLEIAKPISKRHHIPIDIISVKRIKATEPQARLPAKRRKANIKNAFAYAQSPAWKHVAILDDVITTAHTVMTLSRLLHKNGVEKIDIWCCARAH